MRKKFNTALTPNSLYAIETRYFILFTALSCFFLPRKNTPCNSGTLYFSGEQKSSFSVKVHSKETIGVAVKRCSFAREASTSMYLCIYYTRYFETCIMQVVATCFLCVLCVPQGGDSHLRAYASMHVFHLLRGRRDASSILRSDARILLLSRLER